MTSALPPSDPTVLAVLDRYRTCEFATLSKSGVPIAWPTATLRRADGTFLITTSIALPQKAYNIRRDGRVAMLFSEPTASGLDGAPQVLVQGTARCPDEVVTDVMANAEYWRRCTSASRSTRPTAATPSPAGSSTGTTCGCSSRSRRRPGPPGRRCHPAGRRAPPAPRTASRRRAARAGDVPERRPGDDDRGRCAGAAPHPRHGSRGGRARSGRPGGRRPAARARQPAGALPRRAALVAAQRRRPRRARGRPGVDLPSRAAARDAGAATPLAIVRQLRRLRRTADRYLERRSLQQAAGPLGGPEAIKAAGTERRPEQAGARRRRRDRHVPELGHAAEQRQERGVGGVPAGADAHQRAGRRQPGRVDDAPGAVDVGLDHRVEVHRGQPGGVDRDQPRRDLQGPQQGDRQVGVVAAHARPGQQRVDGGVDRPAGTGRVDQPAVHPRRRRRPPAPPAAGCGRTRWPRTPRAGRTGSSGWAARPRPTRRGSPARRIRRSPPRRCR